MILPEWTTTNIILYSMFALTVLSVGPLEYFGQTMMAYSKFRPSKGIDSRVGMFLLYFFPLVALNIAAHPYLAAPSTLQWLVFAAVEIHFAKRVFESLFLHKYSGGMGLMTMILIASFYSFSAYLIGYLNRTPMHYMDIWTDAGVLLFLAGILGNFTHHKILANLRGDSLEYKIPAGGLFNYVVCPHYLFEILIWLGITILSRHLGALLILIFVCGYLTARSLRTLKWYKEKFSDFPADRKAILPFIL